MLGTRLTGHSAVLRRFGSSLNFARKKKPNTLPLLGGSGAPSTLGGKAATPKKMASAQEVATMKAQIQELNMRLELAEKQSVELARAAEDSKTKLFEAA